MLQMWPKRTHATSVSKLRSRRIVMAREDNLEEIIKNIEGNLEEDTKSGMSEEEEMYSWDNLEYKVNIVCFISVRVLHFTNFLTIHQRT